MTTESRPEIGQWLYASCSAEYYGEIIAVGEDVNGKPTIDIRIEDPSDLVDCESIEMGTEPGPYDWENPLTSLELPPGVKAVLRDVQWQSREPAADGGIIVCNTPGRNCYRCTKLFTLHSPEKRLENLKWMRPRREDSK